MKTKRTDEITTLSDTLSVRGTGGNIQSKDAVGVVIDSIVTTAAIVSAAGGLKFLLEVVGLWIEARKERRIKIRKGDVELELQGTMSNKEIAEKLVHFEGLAQIERDSEVKIIIP